jgi:hypothetical protein
MDQRTQQIDQQDTGVTRERPAPAKRPYEVPQVMVMDEKEVLKVFQVTSASISWWG